MTAAKSVNITLSPIDIGTDWRITRSVDVADAAADVARKRHEIREYFHKTFSLHESLYDCLADDRYFYEKAINLRHPLVFYYCHTASFFINKLFLGKYIKKRVNPSLEFLTAVGVDEMSWDDCNTEHYDWPAMKTARDFRGKVRKLVDELICSMPLVLPLQWDTAAWCIVMGIEHERIHLETSSVLIRQHAIHKVVSHPMWGSICPNQSDAAPENSLVTVPASTVKRGKEHYSPNTYGWDNEYGSVTEAVAEFKASKYLVSNQEFLQFMRAGGYSSQKYWTKEGWKWVTQMKITHPEFWVPAADHPEGYRYRAMLQVIDMPWAWPADVNNLEAQAFCQWRTEATGMETRLPTEAEWYAMVDACKLDNILDWKKGEPVKDRNVNLEHWCSSQPVNMFPQGDFGLHDVAGNVWQHTETWFDALDEGFRFHPLYHDFSTPTFDQRHNLIKGGCWASTGNEADLASRYAFRRHFFQHAGFRYVESPNMIRQSSNRLVNMLDDTATYFETERVAMSHLEQHYGDAQLGYELFPVSAARLCLEVAMEKNLTGTAVDVGCAVGRTTFELARQFSKVIGIDKSKRMLWSAMDMHQIERVLWTTCEEAELFVTRRAQFQDFGFPETVAQRVQFHEGDIDKVAFPATEAQLIYCGLVIEYLRKPRDFLLKAKAALLAGGVLIIASAYNWSEVWTDRCEWLGGYVEGINNLSPYHELKRFLTSNGFAELKGPVDCFGVEKISKREHKFVNAEFTFWQKL